MTWAAVWTFLKKIPDWLWYVFIALAAGFFIDMRARDQERAKAKVKRNEDARKVDNKIVENSNEMVAKADRIRAANPVEPDVPGELPNAKFPDYHYRD